MVYLCAPTTYAKQDKQLCDSKIYNFKHEGYHKVKCISKELGYRNTEARGDNDVSRSSHSCECYSPLERCGGTMLPKRHEGSPYLLEPSHQKGSPRSTMEPWGWSPNPHKAWGNLHNLIGGLNNTTKPSRVPRTQEEIISLTFTSTNLRGELTPMHQIQWQVLHSQIPPKLQKLLGE